MKMRDEEFNKIVEDTVDKIKSILIHKAKEYSRDGDRLSNFRRSAALNRTTPETALLGQLSKHVISVYCHVEDLEKGIVASRERWDEKLLDTIDYLVLLRALVIERLENE